MKLIEMIRDILSRHGKEAKALSREEIEEMTHLIENVVDDSRQSNNSSGEEKGGNVVSEGHSKESIDGKVEEGKKMPEEETKEPGSDFKAKRIMAASINVIREFVESTGVDSPALKEVLENLLSIADNIGKRIVTSQMLSTVYNGLHYEEGRSTAFKEGEIAGRNAKIEERYFPSNDDGLPHLRGSVRKRSGNDGDIFSMARNA